MEPVQIGRGDYFADPALSCSGAAAMEPVQIGRGDRACIGPGPWPRGAAMEPVQIGRGDVMVRLISLPS